MKPITLKQAKALKPGDIIYDLELRNSDNTPVRWKVNGRVKTWKTMPERVRVPIKHGMYSYDYLTEDELALVTLEVPSWLL